MNKKETVQILTLLAGNYDSIYKKDKIQKEFMINTWLECLSDLDYELVLQAVKKTMIESESDYHPTVHKIRKNALSLINSSETKTAIEAWDEAYKMICNGLYMTEEQFNLASKEVKEFFGNVRQVAELAKTNIDTVNTVVKGQFLKQYDIIVKRQEEQKLLPEQIKEYSNRLIKKANIRKLET